MIKKRVKVPIYGQYILIILTDDFNPIADIYNLRDTSDYNGCVFKHCSNTVILLKEELDPGTVAHESVHAANLIFEFIGAEVDITNDEPYAYLVGWIVEQIYAAKK